MDELLRLAEDPDAWAALATLIAMEVVLGLDNLVFIALLTNRIDERRRGLARSLGLSLALVFRLALLASASWMVRLTTPLATVLGRAFSVRDLLLLAGGLFLVWKATSEIHHRVDPNDEAEDEKPAPPLGLISGLIQIIMIDIVFSIDSIITAVGMTEYFPIMVIAVVVAVGVMMVAVGPLAEFIRRNPTVLMLALSFLLMIGMTLIADGFGFHIERGYIYAAMFFSSLVEIAQRPGQTQIETVDMTLSSLVLFAAVYFAAVATPGPGVAALVARVLGQGLKGVAPFIAGYFVGDMIWLDFCRDGSRRRRQDVRRACLSQSNSPAPPISSISRGGWRPRPPPSKRRRPPATRGWRAFLSSLSLTLGNPKVMVFFLSIMPLVVDLRALTVLALVELAAVCAIVIFSTLALYAFAANRARASSPLDPGDAVRQSRRRRTHGRGRGRGRHEVRPCRISSRLAKRWSSSTSRRTALRSSRASAATRRTR